MRLYRPKLQCLEWNYDLCLFRKRPLRVGPDWLKADDIDVTLKKARQIVGFGAYVRCPVTGTTSRL